MAELLLFHHVLGLTDGVRAFADDLRTAGHVVHTPDLFDGRVFAEIEAGAAHVDEIGVGTILERGAAAAADLATGLVYAGFSLGVLPAQQLAQTRPGARGAVLMEACVPAAEFGDGWPAGVPVEVHGMDADPFFAGEGDVDAARELVDLASASARATLFLYSGDHHLFTDRSIAAHDPDAAALVVDRVIDFLAALD